jgi:16S rRNA (cytosine967-C5)-methyltransferase
MTAPRQFSRNRAKATPGDNAKTAPRNRAAEISFARKAAFDILMAVERAPSHSDELLRSKAVNALSAPDRNLTEALVLGVLRWQIRLDHEVQALLKRPNAKLDPEVRIALRLGAFQLFFLDRIPARAAIDESVELAKRSGHRFASGLVNAVLRKLAGNLKTAEKTDAAGGGGFTPRIKPAESIGPLEAAEKEGRVGKGPEKRPSGAKAHVDDAALSARLKPCPFKTPVSLPMTMRLDRKSVV